MRVSFNWVVRIWNYIVQIFKETFQSTPVPEPEPEPEPEYNSPIRFDRDRIIEPSFISGSFLVQRRAGGRIGRNPILQDNQREVTPEIRAIMENNFSRLEEFYQDIMTDVMTDDRNLNLNRNLVSDVELARFIRGPEMPISMGYTVRQPLQPLPEVEQPKQPKEPELKTIHGYAQENENSDNREPRLDI